MLAAAGLVGLGDDSRVQSRTVDSPFPSLDDAAIHAFWSALDSTWNGRDADRFSQLFTDDVSFAFVDRGMTLETRDAVLRHFTTQFRDQNPALRHVTVIRRIHPLTPDLVAIDGEVSVVARGAGGSDDAVLRRFAISGVMARPSDRWLVRILRVFPMPAAS
jgi:uncharacterized protein (TIGR02246 family)